MPNSCATTAAAVVTILLGLAYLAAGAALDRRRLVGVATPFVAVALMFWRRDEKMA